MKALAKVALAGSYKKPHSGETTAKLNRNQFIEVTLRIRRKKSLEDHLVAGKRVDHEDYEKEFGASQKDVTKVEDFAHQFKLKTTEVSLPRRSVNLRGSIANMEAAFGVNLLKAVDSHGDDIRVRKGDIFIPEVLKDVVEGVFGLDNRKVARPMYKLLKAEDGGIAPRASVTNSFNPNQLADIYGFPADFNGKGQTIGIIELGGGYRAKDLTKYFKGLKIKKPSIKAISVDKGKNAPSTPDGADGEVMLDIEVAGAVASGAKIVVYFCPNTDKGFLDAITKAVHDKTHKPSVISISWGGAEASWTQQALNTYNEAFKAAAVLGVTILAAAGDNGSSDGLQGGDVHVDFPASSPYVLACGGTSLKVNNNVITSEVVWHDAVDSATGGGVSNVFPLPDYQKNAKVPKAIGTNNAGRGVPDVAANADPNTGYNVLVDGQQFVIGGTSAVAPLYAGLLARINQQNGTPVGFINPKLYAAGPSIFRDITVGNNRTATGNKGYDAGPGWDPCTGLGVFNKLN